MIEEYLSRVNILELIDKIQRFRNLDFKSISQTDVRNELINVLCFPAADGNGVSSCMEYTYTTYNTGQLFYRVRTIPESDSSSPFNAMSKISDCWEPPADIASEGRLNKTGNTLLYTSPGSPVTPINELKIKEGERFSLIIYKTLIPVVAVNVARQFTTKELAHRNADFVTKFSLLNDFIADEFRRDVGKGTEYLYKISQTLIEDYFDHPKQVQDAWLYPSIAHRGTFNVCFRPKMQKKLCVKAAIITKHSVCDGLIIFHPEHVAIKKQGTNRLNYISPAAALMNDLLPGFKYT